LPLKNADDAETKPQNDDTDGTCWMTVATLKRVLK